MNTVAAAYAAKKAELAEERKRREAEREAAKEARRQAMRDYMEHNFLQVPTKAPTVTYPCLKCLCFVLHCFGPPGLADIKNAMFGTC